ncbi:hypothetical protein NDU88_006188 [Pleurodeles waltl]|uniref:Uncharacterized protein n=1 Tax=Pleurodeles waltl TaxID=8319 RepID=A0AAV7LRQ5_PLEWA|nr:hypothetical protein NDU88_006188 [Pleurodeles waltl]
MRARLQSQRRIKLPQSSQRSRSRKTQTLVFEVESNKSPETSSERRQQLQPGRAPPRFSRLGERGGGSLSAHYRKQGNNNKSLRAARVPGKGCFFPRTAARSAEPGPELPGRQAGGSAPRSGAALWSPPLIND